MEDPDLNRNLEETKELHARWSQFRDFFQMAIKGSKVTPQAENKFLELKTRIAMLHDGFLQALTHDHKIGQNVLSILAQCILLRRIPQLSQAETQKLEFDWNEAYLLMTETIANLEEEKESLKDVSEGAYKMRQVRERITTAVHNFFIGPVFKLGVGLACLVALVFAPPFFGFDYMQVKNKWPWTAPVYDRIVASIRFFNSDLRYLSIADIKTYEIKDDYYRPAHGLVQNVNAQWFETQLPLMGFCEADLKEVQAIFQRRESSEFQKEGRRLFAATAQPLHAYYFLLASADDAKRFTELRRRCLEKRQLAATHDQLINVCRRANFIAIFRSAQDELRLTFPQDKFRFKPGEVNL